MPSGGALQPQINAPFTPFSYLFSGQQPAFSFAQQQRIKLKRQRQRVDAGQPRNSYQQPKSTSQSNVKTDSQGTNESSPAVTDLFPSLSWMNPQGNHVEDMSKEEEATDLRMPTQKEPEGEDASSVPDTEEEKIERAGGSRNSHESSASDSVHSAASSSRRKSFFPKKTEAEQPATAAVKNPESVNNEDDEDWIEIAAMEANDAKLEERDILGEDSVNLSALQAQLNAAPANQFSTMIDIQKKIYNSVLEQQKKFAEDEKPRIQRELTNLASTLKNEIMECLAGKIDKVFADYITSEIARSASAAVNLVESSRPVFPPPFYQLPSASQMMNPFHMPSGNSIFPPFNLFGMNQPHTPSRKLEDEGKRKRKAEQPSVRSKMTANASPVDRVSSPKSDAGSPSLTRSTPLSGFFPSMVNHPLYGSFERDGSGADSDDNSEFGPFDPNMPMSSTLTPMHLRKAKLMFFYTRYPNSSLLKTYFPDIRFNKNNTAQLVKWFSNFREFYYIQMEKYARQAVAEGIRNKEDITVTNESDIFKTLNQHYNRNNHIQAPEKLVWVVQETLREFFWAILNTKDQEPSWKKSIYKIICRLDDTIPDFFKDPNFLERLE